MATYYWVGGSGTWDTTSTTNWSSTSGGAGGAGVPTAADTAVFNATSGTVTVTLGEDVSVLTLDATGFTGTLAFSTFKIVATGSNVTVVRGSLTMTCTGTRRVECTYSGGTGTRTIVTGGSVTINAAMSIYVSAGSDTIAIGTNSHVYDLNFVGFSGSFLSSTRTIYGSLAFSPTMTITAFGALTFAATSAGQTLDFGGITYDANIILNGVGGSWQFADDFTMAYGRTFTLTNGTLDANNKNVTIGFFGLGVGTKTLTLGSGTWTVLNGNWNALTNNANLTVSPSTATISMVDAISNKAFNGGGFTWPTLNIGTSIGSLNISQSNTFANITNTVSPAIVRLQAGTTQTVTNFSLSGTAGNLVTLNCLTAGLTATLSDTTGTNSVSYLNIKDIVATGGATWEAYTTNGNVDGGNNTGWIFSTAPAGGSQTSYDLRSFTEKRRF